MKGMGFIQGIKKIEVELSSTSKGVFYNEVELSSTYSLYKNTTAVSGTRATAFIDWAHPNLC